MRQQALPASPDRSIQQEMLEMRILNVAGTAAITSETVLFICSPAASIRPRLRREQSVELPRERTGTRADQTAHAGRTTAAYVKPRGNSKARLPAR